MSITRVSDTVVQNLAKVLLDSVKIDPQASALDTSAIKANTTFRELIDRTFPVMTIISYSDIVSELDKYSLDELSLDNKTILIDAIKQGIAASKALLTPISSQALGLELQSISIDSSISLGAKVQKIKALFSKGYYFTDSNSISGNSDIFVVQNFAAISTRVNKRINDILKSKFKSDVRIGDYLDIGHSSAKYAGTEEYAFNSPKMFGMLFDINNTAAKSFISNTVDLNKASIIYAQKTEQLEQSITVKKSFGNDFLNIFVEFGGSVTLLENSLENQARGRELESKEKFGKNSAVLTKLVSQFKVIKDTAVTGLYNNTNLGTIIRSLHKYAGSPSAIDYIVQLLGNKLTGRSTETFTGTDVVKNATKVITKLPIISGTIKNSSKPSITLRNLQGQFYSASSLMTLINEQLAKRIQDSMGTGQSRTVLNYRSGRLAESAKVERMSTSREGMITAFYSYMNNPYGTFSVGGAQSMPASRDPKLLISKSIREIAATKVANRMRAVLI